MDLKNARQRQLDYNLKGINWWKIFNNKGKQSEDDYYISGVYDQMFRSSTKIGPHEKVVRFLKGLKQNWTDLKDDNYKNQLVADCKEFESTDVRLSYIDGVADEIAYEKRIGTYSDPTIKKEEAQTK